MPNEIIQAVHRLAAANKKHRGIVFTDKYGNVINDNSPEELDNTEITGVSTGVGNINNTESTGVGNINNAESTEVGNINDVEDNTQEYEQENINTGNTETNNTQEYEQPTIKNLKHVKHMAHKNMKRLMMKNQQYMTNK